jgi:NAD+ synthase
MQTVKIIDHIINELKLYCDKAGLKGFVTGVSGGIDSAVTSSLCARTGKSVILLHMPVYQAKDQVSLAMHHIENLEKNYHNVKGVNIELTPAFQAIENSFPKNIQDRLTMGNTRARLRMLTLYAFASHNKMLVAGTGNKVEDFGVGFYTKYGDGGVDISPIANLMKSEVYELGKQLNVSRDILNAPPTDGLWHDNRTDENQLGATYPELEWAMKFEEKRKDEKNLNAREKQVLLIYRKYHRANSHKMNPIPVIKIPESYL